MQALIARVAADWNRLLKKYAALPECAEHNCPVQPIPVVAAAAADKDGVAAGDAGPEFFTRAFYAAQNNGGPLNTVLNMGWKTATDAGNSKEHPSSCSSDSKGGGAGDTGSATSSMIAIGKKSLHHTWDACQHAKPGTNLYHSGTLHSLVPYVYLPQATTQGKLYMLIGRCESKEQVQEFLAFKKLLGRWVNNGRTPTH